jgi:hypothetical protein
MIDVPDDYQELREAYLAVVAKLAEARTEEEGNYQLIMRQGQLLRGVANALKGDPPADTMWSVHDVVELASAMTGERNRYRMILENIVSHVEECQGHDYERVLDTILRMATLALEFEDEPDPEG